LKKHGNYNNKEKWGNVFLKQLKKTQNVYQYGAYCRLGEQLKGVYNFVSKEKVLVLVLDDIAKNPRQEYQKVLSFLGVPDDGKNEFPIYNSRKAVRSVFLAYMIKTLSNISSNIKQFIGFNKEFGIISWMRHYINKRLTKKEILSCEMKLELCNYFKDDIYLLEKLLNRDFSYWLL